MRGKICTIFFLAFVFLTSGLFAQSSTAFSGAPASGTMEASPAPFGVSAPQSPIKPIAAPESSPSKWYEKMNVRGYAQFRYNYLAEHQPDPNCESCNSNPLKSNGFEFRRARLAFTIVPSDRFTFYLQLDYSADGSGNNKHFVQLRDAYADIFLTKNKAWNLRLGQSKVPFGFENMQSSSNRLPLDRAEALNSAVPSERDLGAFLYWAAPKKRKLLRSLTDNFQKGSGDYGLFAFGIYNGQGINKTEQNDKVHVVSRFCWPFELPHNQIIEPAIQAYSGRYTLPKEQISSGVKTRKDLTYNDSRVAGSLVLYPRPFGVALEYNTGFGPAFDANTDSITTRRLSGGYLTLSYRKELPKHMMLLPYARFQVFEGGRKADTDMRLYDMQETEIGFEFAPTKNVEVTLAYMNSHRHTIDSKANIAERRHWMRLQVQLNY